jgi:hemoglobin
VAEVRSFGDGDTSLQAMGGEAGVAALVGHFYDLMETRPEAAEIRGMHPADLTESRAKLTAFLVGWLGGPKRYAERWGEIRIPRAHAHLPIGPAQRDQWLTCMDQAIAQMPVSDEFRAYFREEIRVPANRVVDACAGRGGGGGGGRRRK